MRFIVISFSFFIFSVSFAQTKKQPLSLASSTKHEAELSASHISFESYKNQSSQTDTNLYLGYHYHMDDNIQIGGEAGVLSVPNGTKNKSMSALMAIFTLNADSSNNIREALFIQLAGGTYPSYDKDSTGSKYKSAFSVFGGIGKRFEMWGKVNYKPYARIWKRGDEQVRYEVQLLNFSIFY